MGSFHITTFVVILETRLAVIIPYFSFLRNVMILVKLIINHEIIGLNDKILKTPNWLQRYQFCFFT